jgi:hypothetical protein
MHGVTYVAGPSNLAVALQYSDAHAVLGQHRSARKTSYTGSNDNNICFVRLQLAIDSGNPLE